MKLDMEQLVYKLSVPRLFLIAGEFIKLDMTIGLYGNAPLQDLASCEC
jgi:hypothetical protein